jgi:hypothetical protein
MKNILTRLKGAIKPERSDFVTIILTMLVVGITNYIFGDFDKWISKFTFLYSLLGSILGLIVAKFILNK